MSTTRMRHLVVVVVARARSQMAVLALLALYRRVWRRGGCRFRVVEKGRGVEAKERSWHRVVGSSCRSLRPMALSLSRRRCRAAAMRWLGVRRGGNGQGEWEVPGPHAHSSHRFEFVALNPNGRDEVGIRICLPTFFLPGLVYAGLHWIGARIGVPCRWNHSLVLFCLLLVRSTTCFCCMEWHSEHSVFCNTQQYLTPIAVPASIPV